VELKPNVLLVDGLIIKSFKEVKTHPFRNPLIYYFTEAELAVDMGDKFKAGDKIPRIFADVATSDIVFYGEQSEILATFRLRFFLEELKV
jgi:hypothetical protein